MSSGVIRGSFFIGKLCAESAGQGGMAPLSTLSRTSLSLSFTAS